MSTQELAVRPITLSDVRKRIGPLLTEAVHKHRPIPIIRGSSDLGMLLGLEEISRLVEGVTFSPEVFKEGQAVSVWLPEFQIYGRGKDLGSARADLLEEVREYVFEYLDEDEVWSAPNRRAHFPHIIKALVADLSGKLDTVVFEDRVRVGAKEPIAAADVR